MSKEVVPMSISEKRLMLVFHAIQDLENNLMNIIDDPEVSEAVLTNVVSRIEEVFVNMEDKVGWNADLLHLLHQVLDNRKELMTGSADNDQSDVTM